MAKAASQEQCFEVGDIVRLKSGGPSMTVGEFSSVLGGYACRWFAGKKLEQGIFKHEQLETVKPEPKGD